MIAGFMSGGCEIEPTTQASVTITPQTVTLRSGQSQEFKASGGAWYQWSLSESTQRWGILNTTSGEKVTYTSILSPTNNTTNLQVLTVTAFYGHGNTNEEAYTVTGEAYIFHAR
jgi:hypothetical protein